MVLPALSNRGQGYRSASPDVIHPSQNASWFQSRLLPVPELPTHTHILPQKWLYLQRLYIQSRLTLLDWTKHQSTQMTLSLPPSLGSQYHREGLDPVHIISNLAAHKHASTHSKSSNEESSFGRPHHCKCRQLDGFISAESISDSPHIVFVITEDLSNSVLSVSTLHQCYCNQR